MKQIKSTFLILIFFLLVQVSFAQTESKVYTTRTGVKYHTSTCEFLAKSKYETTLKKAKEDGYTACKVCKPSSSITNTQNLNSTSKQCTAIPKQEIGVKK